jgi:GNAT superfamily N-acetyltransferase
MTIKCWPNLSGSSRLVHNVAMIRPGTPADLPAASDVYRRASLFNAGDRDNLLAHPGHLILGPEGLAEGRTHVAEQDGSLVGFATWSQAGGIIELEDLFIDPGWMRRGIATALVNRIADVLRARGAAAAGWVCGPAAAMHRTIWPLVAGGPASWLDPRLAVAARLLPGGMASTRCSWVRSRTGHQP